ALGGPAAYAVDTVGTAHNGSIITAGPSVKGAGFGPGSFGKGGKGGRGFPGGFGGGQGGQGQGGQAGQGGQGGQGGFGGRGGQGGHGFPGGQNGQGGQGGQGGGQGGFARGTVKAVDGSTVYLTDANGNTIKVTTGDSTKVQLNKQGKVADLQPGQSVTVVGTPDSSGGYNATQLVEGAAGAGAGGFGGGGAGGGGGFGGGAPKSPSGG
ncbi:hypothetical protein ACFVGN_43665, partial [Streptomyces sp. NPDC057757]